MKLLVPVLAATLAFAGACANDSTSPTVSIQGNWSLRTLNGQTLPVQVDPTTVVTSEQLTLNNDGSYQDVVYYQSGNYSTEVGYYTVNNNQVTFNDQTDALTYYGSISGNVLTSISGNYTSVYQKS